MSAGRRQASLAARVAAAGAEAARLAGPTARPVPRERLLRPMADGLIPPELGAVFQHVDGLSLDECDVWDIADTLAFSGAAAIAREYPGGVVFGWNRADVLLMIDAGDSLHAGAGAIIGLDKIYFEPGTAVVCAPDLAAFLAEAAPGRHPWRGETQMQRQGREFAGLLNMHRDRVDSRPPLTGEEVVAAAARAEVQLTDGLMELYRITGGLRFARSGLLIEGPQGLRPVPGSARADGVPAAIRIGGLPNGPDLVLTVPGGERPSELVLQWRPGTDYRSSPAFGRLFPTLIGWIGSDAENAP